jgi:hypothetical protein
MRLHFQFLLMITVCLLISTATCLAQTEASTKVRPVLEVVYTSCNKNCDLDTTRLYADGRFFRETRGSEPAKSGRYRPVTMTEEKVLEPEEVSEVLSWARKPDFLNADSAYVERTIDNRDELAITYRYDGKEKKVRLVNYGRGIGVQKPRVPASILKLASWAQPYNFPER